MLLCDLAKSDMLCIFVGSNVKSLKFILLLTITFDYMSVKLYNNKHNITKGALVCHSHSYGYTIWENCANVALTKLSFSQKK